MVLALLAVLGVDLIVIDGLAGAARAAKPGEVKRLGIDPVIFPLAADGGAR